MGVGPSEPVALTLNHPNTVAVDGERRNTVETQTETLYLGAIVSVTVELQDSHVAAGRTMAPSLLGAGLAPSRSPRGRGWTGSGTRPTRCATR